MYTNLKRTIPPDRLTLGKHPSHFDFRLAARPPQIAVRLRVWVKRRPGKARAPITMRSEIARQHRPKAVPFGPFTFTAGCHVLRNTQAPQAREKLPLCLLNRPGPGPNPLIRAPLEVLGPEPLGRVVPFATPRPPFRTRHGTAPSDSAPAHVRDRFGKADLLLHLSSFIVDCIGSHLLLQLVFIRRGSVLRGRRRCSGRIRCCCCCLGRLVRHLPLHLLHPGSASAGLGPRHVSTTVGRQATVMATAPAHNPPRRHRGGLWIIAPVIRRAHTAQCVPIDGRSGRLRKLKSWVFFFFTRRSTDQHATHNSSGVRPHR